MVDEGRTMLKASTEAPGSSEGAWPPIIHFSNFDIFETIR